MMQPAASSIFDFIEKNKNYSVHRHEIASASFGTLRRALRSIIRQLRDSQNDEGNDIADQLRVLLFTWLTAPVDFNNSIVDAIKSFGEPAFFQLRWGLSDEYQTAILAAEAMTQAENPLRTRLREIITHLRTSETSFRIFCHRRSRQHFETLLTPPLDDSLFLHSVAGYNNSEPFDTLLKTGPLRSGGWGAVPDAIISAPRFERLIQLVWSGCADEPGFGYDPVAPPPSQGAEPNQPSPAIHDAIGNRVSWKKTTMRTGEDPFESAGYSPGQDEFYILRESGERDGKRLATLVELPDEVGLLYPPRSKVLSFDPESTAPTPFDLRQLGESLVPGIFVVIPQLGDLDFDNVKASEGHFSSIWKQNLKARLALDPDDLFRQLRENGVTLQHIRACIERWCDPPTTVIHAPQQAKHFKALIDVLRIPQAASPGFVSYVPWWQRAWNEIRISRGEAIQAGVTGQEVIEEQALHILNGLLSEARQAAAGSSGFRLAIPEGRDLTGGFVFHKIVEIEEGFLVPETELRVICDLETIEQWRVA